MFWCCLVCRHHISPRCCCVPLRYATAAGTGRVPWSNCQMTLVTAATSRAAEVSAVLLLSHEMRAHCCSSVTRPVRCFRGLVRSCQSRYCCPLPRCSQSQSKLQTRCCHHAASTQSRWVRTPSRYWGRAAAARCFAAAVAAAAWWVSTCCLLMLPLGYCRC